MLDKLALLVLQSNNSTLLDCFSFPVLLCCIFKHIRHTEDHNTHWKKIFHFGAIRPENLLVSKHALVWEVRRWNNTYQCWFDMKLRVIHHWNSSWIGTFNELLVSYTTLDLCLLQLKWTEHFIKSGSHLL